MSDETDVEDEWVKLDEQIARELVDVPEKDRSRTRHAHQATMSVARGLFLQEKILHSTCGNEHESLNPQSAYQIAMIVLQTTALIPPGQFGAMCNSIILQLRAARS